MRAWTVFQHPGSRWASVVREKGPRSPEVTEQQELWDPGRLLPRRKQERPVAQQGRGHLGGDPEPPAQLTAPAPDGAEKAGGG